MANPYHGTHLNRHGSNTTIPTQTHRRPVQDDLLLSLLARPQHQVCAASRRNSPSLPTATYQFREPCLSWSYKA